jgi:hypothetical protein
MKITVIGLALMSVLSMGQAQSPKAAVDTSLDGIFTALTSSTDLQATVDMLIAQGANHRTVISIAAAAGIAESKVQNLQVCVNTVSADVKVLGVTCLLPRSVMIAYAAGISDPLNFLPATAAGKRLDTKAD